MPVIDMDAAPRAQGEDGLGRFTRRALGDAGGLSQFGVAVETLWPGSRSSDRHYHEEQDEFLLMLDGTAVLVEEDGETALAAGDAVAWPKGVANAHMLRATGAAPCRYLVVGARTPTDRVHYPDLGLIKDNHADGSWVRRNAQGQIVEEGASE